MPQSTCSAHGEVGCLRCAFEDTTVVPIIVNFLLDASGSMGDILQSTVESFNEYVKGLRSHTGVNYRFTLVRFNHEVSVPFSAVPLNEIPALGTEANPYRADGNTSLLDAVGNSIEAVEAKIKDMKDKPAVLFVILTDGEDTSSNKWSKDKISKLVSKKEKEGNWTFVFTGANQDAWTSAQNIGISSKGNTRSFRATSAGVAGTMSAISGSSALYANSVSSSWHAGNLSKMHVSNYFSPEELKTDQELVKTVGGGKPPAKKKSKK